MENTRQVRELRVKKGLRLIDVSIETGISMTALSRYERAKDDPTFAEAVEISRVIGGRPKILFPDVAERFRILAQQWNS